MVLILFNPVGESLFSLQKQWPFAKCYNYFILSPFVDRKVYLVLYYILDSHDLSLRWNFCSAVGVFIKCVDLSLLIVTCVERGKILVFFCDDYYLPH